MDDETTIKISPQKLKQSSPTPEPLDAEQPSVQGESIMQEHGESEPPQDEPVDVSYIEHNLSQDTSAEPTIHQHVVNNPPQAAQDEPIDPAHTEHDASQDTSTEPTSEHVESESPQDGPNKHIEQLPDQDTATESTESADQLPAQDEPILPKPTEQPLPQSEPLVPLAKRRKKRKRSPLFLALSAFMLIIFIGCGALSFGYYYYTIQQPLKKLIRPVKRVVGEPAINTTPTYDVIKGRSWNILLLGSDNDNKYVYPAVLTQVMMVIHIDTVDNTVSLVSIPRDSWVNVPNVGGMHKIDQAFLLGVNQNNSFDSGVQLARLTIERDYGITIDRYGWVGLSGFAKVIDTLGGVDVDITHPLVDDTYPDDTGKGTDPNSPYAYTRLYLAPGPQHLSGVQALEYVRSRHADLVGDIGRTQRQQQVLEALKLKLTASSIVSNLPTLIKDVTGQVYTDLSQDEIIAFANFGRTLSGSQIHRITLGPGKGDQNFGNYATIFDPSINLNQDVIIPHCDTIQPIVNRIFDLGDTQSCNVNGQSSLFPFP